jgi:ACT domain-containing protein
LKFLVLNSNLQPLVEAINTLVAVAVIDISSSMTPSHSSSAFLPADLTYFKASSSPYY